MKKYVLDACALIAVLNKEPGAESVKEILEQSDAETAVYMSIVNLLEVYYGILRECGDETARKVLSSLRQSSIEIVANISEQVFAEAG